MNEVPWYQTFFGDDYLRIYAFPPEWTERQVEGIVKLLALPPGSAILSTSPEIEAALERVWFYKGTFALQEAQFGIENGNEEAFYAGLADVGP